MHWKKLIGAVLAMAAGQLFGESAHMLTIGEGFVQPLGFHDASPTFSWKLPEGVKAQTAYQLQVSDAGNGHVLWDSQWVKSDQSVFVPYQGPELESRQKISWRVRFKDEHGQDAAWSKIQHCEYGLLSNADWEAEWIRSTAAFNPKNETVSWFRNEFKTARPVKQARLYATAKGAFEIYLNGQRIGDEHFAPGWTAYQSRIDTMTYDVTAHLKNGENAIGAVLGTGWYGGRIWWKHDKTVKGQKPELLVQLEIIYEDGKKDVLVSNDQWKETQNGPILFSAIYDGEDYDARKSIAGWSEVGYDDADWKNALSTSELGTARLTPKSLPPVRVQNELTPISITEPTPGHFVYDFGQNFVGKIRFENLPLKSGNRIQGRVAELLNQDGTMYTDNYRSAKCIIKYTAADDKPFAWTQTFTFYGCRYVELSGLPEGVKPKKEWLTAQVLYNDMQPVGTFTSSHEKLNQLQSNIVWGQRGNFLEAPTDCPQRDERMGWTGDAQAFCSTAMFNYDCLSFFKSWLESMRADQMDDGRIPHVIPAIYPRGGSAGWMDAATIIPWEVYLRTGDAELLSDNLAMMEKLAAFYDSKVSQKEGVMTEFGGFGDWLQPYAADRPGDTSKGLITTAFYANTLDLVVRTCTVIGETAKAEKYAKEHQTIKQAFAAYYLNEKGTIKNAAETQTSYVLALQFNLVPEGLKKHAVERLKHLIEEADGHLRTGFLGTPYLTSVLSESGNPDAAFDLLFKETYPSWFYSINQGATTMWERWNSYSHEDGFGDAKMNSFNHYAYGAVGNWMYERVAGLCPDPVQPGYKHFFIRPLIGGPLTSVRAELETPYGKASSAWKKSGRKLELEAEVPPNSTATIEFPNGRKSETVGAGVHRFVLDM